MKKISSLLMIIVIILITVIILPFLTRFNHRISYIIAFCFAVIFVFNLITRYFMIFKTYFLSNYNLFSSKFQKDVIYDIPKELLMKKVIESINESEFKIKFIDNDNFKIFAISSTTFQSWGENIYIDFIDKKGETLLKFNSVAISQIYSWGKNKENYKKIINEIEKSLTI